MDMVPEECQQQPETWSSIEPGLIIPGLPKRLNKERARLWALVLDARGVPCCLEQPDPGRWELHVPPEQLDAACLEISRYEEKNRNWPPLPLLYREMPDNSLATISVLILLASFHNITKLKFPVFGSFAPDWLELGSAKVHLIHYGEWWRLVTALTLHADWLHLLSNLTIGGFFIVALCRELRSGLAWMLLLAAGTLGNWANAQIQFPTHSSVGASTAVFGAVGILAAINLVRHRHDRPFKWQLPVASALALLALLGTEGKNTDLGAHLFGFVSGAGLGLVTERIITRYGHPGALLNALLAIAAAAIVIVAWLAAVAAG